MDYAESTDYTGLIYSNELIDCGGGCYIGPSPPFTISISPGFSSQPDYTGPDPFKIQVWAKAQDSAGNTSYHFYGYYTMPNTCDG